MSTRPTRVRYFLLSFLILLNLLPSSQVFAELISEGTVLLPTAPLLITSYQTESAGTDIAFIEVYNTGSELVDLSKWEIYDLANNRSLVFHTDYAGYVRPDTHVVVSRDGVVRDATYTIDGWATEVEPAKTLTTLRLINSIYRPADVSAKTNGIQQIRNYGVSSYLTTFTEGASRSLFDDGLYESPPSPVGVEVSEVYAYASECSPLDASVLCGDYIELHNTSDAQVDLTDLVLRTDSSSSSRTASNTFSLSGMLAPDDYLTINMTDDGGRISLTNSGGYIWLEDVWDIHAYAEYMTQWPSVSSDQQGFAYMHDDTGAWVWTTTPTPGFTNVLSVPIAVIAECPAGKYRSLETGRCRTLEEAVNELAACEEGYERNPTTNRCRKITLTSSSSLAACSEGQERNPATNRCRSIASAVAELIPCDEGYERNPTTNRCRKVQSTVVPTAPFAVDPVASDIPVWQWWIGGAIAAGLAGYAVWEWRHELGKIWSRLFKRQS